MISEIFIKKSLKKKKQLSLNCYVTHLIIQWQPKNKLVTFHKHSTKTFTNF